VLLVGPSGSGKSTFARRNFSPTQIISSDYCRALVCDDESNQGATAAAFEVLHCIVGKRMDFGMLVVVDATNVEPSARSSLLSVAKDAGYPVVGVVFDVNLEVALAHNALRTDRRVGAPVIARQLEQLKASRQRLSREGFSKLHVLRDPVEIAATAVKIE
jgi:predicted kinase